MPVRAQIRAEHERRRSLPDLPPEPTEIRIGVGFEHLEQDVPFDHLTPRDVQAVKSADWLPPGLVDEEDRQVLADARQAVTEARAALGSLKADVMSDAATRVLMEPKDAEKRPRPDYAALQAKREEASVRAELRLLQVADDLLGRIRVDLPERIKAEWDRMADAERKVAEARRMLTEAEADRRDAATAEAWLNGQRRVAVEPHNRHGILTWPLAAPDAQPEPEDHHAAKRERFEQAAKVPARQTHAPGTALVSS